MIKTFLRYLFVGALSLSPLVVVLMLVNFLKSLGISAYLRLYDITDSFWITIALVVLVIMLFTVLGYSIERYGKSMIVTLIDRIFESIPAIRTVYSIFKKIANMFSGNDESGKKEVVLVEYPKNDVWVPAYVLNRYEGISVLFVPTSPNPTSGYTVIVKDSLCIPVSLTLEEASSFIISMGADFAKREEIALKIKTHPSAYM